MFLYEFTKISIIHPIAQTRTCVTVSRLAEGFPALVKEGGGPIMATGISESIRRIIPFRVRRLLRSGIVLRPSHAEDFEIQLKQLQDILRHEHQFVPPPPKSLQVRVLGLYSPDFVESGWQTFQTFANALAKVGCYINSCENVLDFGCGCGRVIRAFHQMSPQSKLFGTDIDPEAIQWLRSNYPRFGIFSLNSELPPLPFGDDSFDLIYSISVFTHLPEKMQLEWLAELRRVSKPGGFILATTYDQNRYSVLNVANRTEFLKKGFCYVHEEVPTTDGLPAFYQTTFHSHDYIRRVWADFFEVVDIEPLAVDGHSDLVVLRRRSS
jgi:ubiquinone/menaquinone biosynthesis C-methylase UbiE